MRALRQAGTVLLVLFACLLGHLPALAGTAAQPAAALERYGGEGQLGSEPPFPLHLEITRSGENVRGVISTPGAAFTLVDARGRGTVAGRVTGDGGTGSIRLRFEGDQVEGEFELEGQRGRLQAKRTRQEAAAFFKGPDQRLDLTPDQWRQDLDHLVELLRKHHGSPFHRTPEPVFLREVRRVRSAIPQLDGSRVGLELSKLGALIGDGHTWVAFPQGRPRFNLEAYWFEDGLRVVGADPAQKDLLGTRIVAVDGVPISEVIRRLRIFAAQGETDWSYRSVAPYLLGSADMLEMAGVGRGNVRLFTFETAGGQRRVPLTASVKRPERVMLGGGPPLWDRGTEPFRTQWLPDGALYVNWRGYDQLAEHTKALMAELDRKPPRRLIIDLRDNGGGDYNHGRQFIAQITSREWLNNPDKLFVLTGRQTFSAAMTNAVDFRTGTRATLIGEPPGAAPNNWQEVRRFHLPNSGLAVGISTRYYEFLPGEAALHPDKHVPPVPSDWGAPWDAAVAHVLGSAPRQGGVSR